MAKFIYGRNSVIAALEIGRCKKVYVSYSFKDERILSLANKNNISIARVDNNELSKLSNSNNTQGVIAEVSDYKYYELTDLINEGKKVKNPIIIMLDEIEDPHNLGAILRIVDAFNAVGVIIKKNSQAPLNATVDKVSTGAINYVKVAQVSNLNNSIKKLKEEGYWIFSSDGEGTSDYQNVDYNLPIVLIIGSEGRGVSRLVKENSDYIIRIPMYGHVNSLNASNALSVLLSHIVNSRNPSK